MSRSLKSVKSNPLAGKVKKLMQTDEDVGKIAQGAPLLLDANRLQAFAACRKAYVASNGKMDFLADKVATVPDFAEEEAAPAKKQRSDLELASSSSGLQLSGTISPPPSSKGSRGRGRGRSRSRGSVRLAAPDSRIGQVKDEQESASPAQTMPDATPAKPAETSTDFQIKTEAHATDAAMPQAQSSDLESLSRGVQSHDRVPAADMLAVKHEQPAMQVPGGQQMPQVTPNPASEQAQALPVTQPQIPDMPFLTAATTLKRSEIAVEEDDYDADD